MLFVEVPFVFFELAAGADYLPELRPLIHPLQIVYLKAWVRGTEPVPPILAEEQVAVVQKVLLFAPKFLHVVDVGLVVFETF